MSRVIPGGAFRGPVGGGLAASIGVIMTDLEKRFPFRKGHFQIFSHPYCLLHEVGEWHPETPARLRSILRGCATLPVHLPVSFRVPRPATISQLELVHDKDYLL